MFRYDKKEDFFVDLSKDAFFRFTNINTYEIRNSSNNLNLIMKSHRLKCHTNLYTQNIFK